MAKTVITIDDELLTFIRSDAAKDRRSMAGQICKLIELAQAHGGYEGLLEAIIRADAARGQTAAKTETRGRKRSRPQRITWSNFGACGCAAVLYNSDDDKALIVKTDNPEVDMQGVIQMLKRGKFPLPDVQSDYSDKCCKFEVLSGFGETIEEVKSNCDAAEFYVEVYDCTGVAEEPEIHQRPNEDTPEETAGHDTPTLSDVLAINWETMSHQQTLRRYLVICKNPEVRELAQEYIETESSPEDELEPETVFAEDAAIIMDRFCRKYRK